jgi:ABC-2 type transport system permease protein
MSKIALVARREFLTRVQKKTFLLTTILFPVIIFGFYAMIIYFSVESDADVNIAVVDNADIFKGNIEGNNDIHFNFLKNETPESLKKKIESNEYSGYVYIPSDTRLLYNDTIR